LGNVETLVKEGKLKKAGVSKPTTAAVNKAKKITYKALQPKTTRRRNYSTSTKSLSTTDYISKFGNHGLSLKGDAFEIWEHDKNNAK
jgi:hypothetical protein